MYCEQQNIPERKIFKNFLGQKPYKCTHCPIMFSTKSNRERHMIRKHGLDIHDPATRQMMDRPFKCHLCVFSSFSAPGKDFRVPLLLIFLLCVQL